MCTSDIMTPPAGLLPELDALIRLIAADNVAQETNGRIAVLVRSSPQTALPPMRQVLSELTMQARDLTNRLRDMRDFASTMPGGDLSTDRIQELQIEAQKEVDDRLSVLPARRLQCDESC